MVLTEHFPYLYLLCQSLLFLIFMFGLDVVNFTVTMYKNLTLSKCFVLRMYFLFFSL